MTHLNHIPIRTCVGCGTRKRKQELVRIVRDLHGSIAYDPSGKAPGRGAYLCPNISCARLAKKNRALDRSFRQKVADSVYEDIIAQHGAIKN